MLEQLISREISFSQLEFSSSFMNNEESASQEASKRFHGSLSAGGLGWKRCCAGHGVRQGRSFPQPRPGGLKQSGARGCARGGVGSQAGWATLLPEGIKG